MKSTDRWKQAMHNAWLLARNQWSGDQLRGDVRVEITVCQPDPGQVEKKLDEPNVLKLTLDALQDAAYADDCQVDQLELIRVGVDDPIYDDDGYVSVTIIPLDSEG